MKSELYPRENALYAFDTVGEYAAVRSLQQFSSLLPSLFRRDQPVLKLIDRGGYDVDPLPFQLCLRSTQGNCISPDNVLKSATLIASAWAEVLKISDCDSPGKYLVPTSWLRSVMSSPASSYCVPIFDILGNAANL
ncbi:hypothetical protein U1Q18_036570 [Sarracenia purpurea var. burkii]